MTETVDTERRRFYRDLALLLGLPFLAAVGILAFWRPWKVHYDVGAKNDVHAVISGEWDWAAAEGFCKKNPHTISFSPDRKLMTIRHVEPWTDSAGVAHRVAEYDLEEVSRHHVRGQIRGETRLTAAGEPVVWDLVLTSPNSYRWQRADWPFWGYTPEVRRCPAGTDSTISQN
jgi:hypothetical protein